VPMGKVHPGATLGAGAVLQDGLTCSLASRAFTLTTGNESTMNQDPAYPSGTTRCRPSITVEDDLSVHPRASGTADMQGPASELSRIYLMGTSVNKGKEKGQSAWPRPFTATSAQLLSVVMPSLHKRAHAQSQRGRKL
jgi:hypothetical protein